MTSNENLASYYQTYDEKKFSERYETDTHRLIWSGKVLQIDEKSALNNVKDGLCAIYNPDGSKLIEAYCSNGILSGTFKQYHYEKVQMEIHFFDGIINNINIYDDQGDLAQKHSFTNGKLSESIFYGDDSGSATAKISNNKIIRLSFNSPYKDLTDDKELREQFQSGIDMILSHSEQMIEKFNKE